MKRLWSGHRGAVAAFAAVLLAVLGWVAAASLHDTTSLAQDNSPPPSPQNRSASVDYANQLSAAFRSAAVRVLPAVVMIQARPAATSPSQRSAQGKKREPGEQPDLNNSPFGELFRNHPELRPFFKDFQIPEEHEYTVASGSGVIIDPSGWILTNHHVVQGAGEILVQLQDGRQFKATDVHADPTSDLAILRISAKEPLPAAQLGDSRHIQVGDWVLALGEPFGLQGTVTAGIISATGRSVGITGDGALLQTDAAINPGSSGGPLVDLNGQVIGINTAISTRSGGNEGIGFAIPSEEAKWVVPQLMATGSVERAYLGAVIQLVNQDLATQFGVQVHEGVLISEVMPNTPAAKAGLRPGDIVTEFAGQKMTTPEQLRKAVQVHKVGSSQPLVVLRNGQEMTLTVTLEARPKAEQAANNQKQENAEPGEIETVPFDKLGVEVATLTPKIANQLGINANEGLVITNVTANSPADRAGLTEGLVITQADGKPVKNPEDLQTILNNKPTEKGLLLLVRSTHGSRFVVLHPAG